MSDDRFGKWWPCLRKHYKRTHLWLPQAQTLQQKLGGKRPFRYFTLCARPMIDVYMLVNEQILPFDTKNNRVQGVSFCECNKDVFPEMLELVGVEEAGFLAQLEDLVLLQDIPRTQTLDSIPAVTEFLEEEGEGLDPTIRKAAENKIRHILFRNMFPFDFLNLDFCDRYYGKPPDTMKLHATIDRILDWQRRPNKTQDGQEFAISQFVAAITCRVDLTNPPQVLKRLKEMVTANCSDHPNYKKAVQDRDPGDIDTWANDKPLDFFMSAWPKEIIRMAKQKSWNITVHDHAFYERQNDEGETYHMVCLVAEFSQTNICTTYLTAATKCLDADSRNAIPRFDPKSGKGAALLSNLREIVTLRNEQAKRFHREPLPEPLAEITRLQAEGVQI